MELPSMYLQVQDMMLVTVFQEVFRKLVTLIHPVSSLYPLTAPKFDSELGVNESGLL